PALDIGVHIAHRLRYLAGEVATVSALTRTFEPRRVRRTGAPSSVVAETGADVDDAFFSLIEFANGAAGAGSVTSVSYI
ncbi:MAG TPA: gfo/Idh/MocA family oxidoreductase, partial [Chloroflexi bacterium]|nr:gfo/Idh/MocA family oxidoreductase [Chloroflexota bacterium]